ncbi:MAG: peptidoglycan DD-metalloendopeptidase family protein [Spirulina sp. SIO3F2]|nr:peptidoglycan DD-metalloendopeptidase family protein [Spirulina sp. SIO3F2]
MSQTRHPSFTLLRSSLLTRSLGILSGLGLLSSGLAWSQTDVLVDNLGSTAPPAATPVPATPPPAPAQLNKAPKPSVAPVTAPAPKPAVSTSQPLPTPTVSVPPRSTPSPSPSNRPDSNPAPRPPVAAQPPAGQTQIYIDQTQYGSQPVPGTSVNPQVVVHDRNQACKTVVQNGRLTQGSCGNGVRNTTQSAQAKPIARQGAAHPPRVAIPNALNQPPRPLARRGVPPLTPAPQQKSAQTVRRVVPESFNLPQLVNRALKRPAPYPNNGNRGLLFPLGFPADISSVFGWRLHPISGDWRMHNGTDLAAPQGTPVVAAYHGEVVLAEMVGGYGNLVVMRHEDGHQESRYAHLEHIFVQPGEWVEQGEVIGLVGNTGNSTGPHLHFEWRHWVANNWIPVDAGPQLQWALAEMRQAMLRTLPPEQRAQLAPEPAPPELGNIALGSGLLLITPDAAVSEGSDAIVQTDSKPSPEPLKTESAKPEAESVGEATKPLFDPQPLYRLEQSNPDQPLKALPAKELQNSAIAP